MSYICHKWSGDFFLIYVNYLPINLIMHAIKLQGIVHSNENANPFWEFIVIIR